MENNAEPVGPLRRICAFLLNAVPFMLVYWGISFLASSGSHETEAATDVSGIQCGALAALALLSALFNSSRRQATPGKLLCNIHVIRASDGSRISRARAVFRIVMYVGPLLVFSLLVSLYGHLSSQASPDTAKYLGLLTLLMFLIGILELGYYITLIYSLSDSDKRSFVDIICDTRVVKGRPKA
jgi:uncharacterized RDD family membrane protein YckC